MRAAMPDQGKTDMRRFTVSLEASTYDELKEIAASQRPPLTLQYIVRYALVRFLDENRGRQLKLDID